MIKKSPDLLKLFGLGKLNKGQLAYRRKTKNESPQACEPREIVIELEDKQVIKSIVSGGLGSYTMVGEKKEKKAAIKKKAKKVEETIKAAPMRA